MSGLDPRFVVAPDLQMVFVEKSTGLPLSAGTVKFWEDAHRTVPKPVYAISGTPPNYIYTALPTTVTLTGGGTFSDNSNNDIIPYYFPFDGTPDSTTNTQQLYYIEVFDSNGVLQFTREGWPNNAGSGTEAGLTDFNFVPNPQFLFHRDYFGGSTTKGLMTATETNVAYGDWWFERPSNSATDYVLFTQESATVGPIPPGTPRYLCNVKNTVPHGADAYKYLTIFFGQVNTFASSTQDYTFVFTAGTNNGQTIPVSLVLQKSYGAGGSPATTQTLTTFNIGPNTGTTANIFLFPFKFGDNSGKTIGTGDNDNYVGLSLNFPTNVTFDISLTSFCLFLGDISLPVAGNYFPVTSEEEMGSLTFPGLNPVPNPDGSDLWLPLVLGPNGYIPSKALVGTIYACDTAAPDPTWGLPCDGASYNQADYSQSGIPYSRLYNALTVSAGSLTIGKNGTGANFVTCAYDGNSSHQVQLITNTAGSVTASANHSLSTGFAIATPKTGNVTYGLQSAWLGSASFMITNVFPGLTTAAAAGTTSFTVAQLQAGNSVMQQAAKFTVNFTLLTDLEGEYFTYDTFYPDAMTGVAYYVWFKVNGVGADPAVGGRTGILINLTGYESKAEVAQKIAWMLNGWQVTTITPSSTPPAGSAFTFSSSGSDYYVYYVVDGSGIDPLIPARTSIVCHVLSTDNANQLAIKTGNAVNATSFAVPHLNGVGEARFLRGVGSTSGVSYSMVPGIDPTTVTGGTYEAQGIQPHSHTGTVTTGAFADGSSYVGRSVGIAPSTQPLTIDNSTDGTETRPVNYSVVWAIKY